MKLIFAEFGGGNVQCENCPYSEIPERHKNGIFQDEYAWCDKVGGQHYQFGYCKEAYEVDNTYMSPPHALKSRSTKRSRREKYNNKLKRLYSFCGWYPSPVIKSTWTQDELPYYKRSYRGNHKGNRYRFYKNYSNRMVRRCKDVPHHGGYKKVFDYWWTVD